MLRRPCRATEAVAKDRRLTAPGSDDCATWPDSEVPPAGDPARQLSAADRTKGPTDTLAHRATSGGQLRTAREADVSQRAARACVAPRRPGSVC